MRATRRFLFLIPVETRRSRRAVVVGYYGFFTAFAILLLWLRGPEKYDRLLPLAYYFAVMLGGLAFSGPVKLFSEWQRKFRNGSVWGIDPNRPHPYLPGQPMIATDRLDEQDIATRDRAHYLAYSALRWPAIAAALFSPLFLLDATPAQVGRILFLISVPLAVVFFSLPQAIILWQEPDIEPDPEQHPTQTVVRILP